MAKKQGVHHVTLAIHFTFDDERASEEDAVCFAKDLAINPNYDTLINGVGLEAVRIEEESEITSTWKI